MARQLPLGVRVCWRWRELDFCLCWRKIRVRLFPEPARDLKRIDLADLPTMQLRFRFDVAVGDGRDRAAP